MSKRKPTQPRGVVLVADDAKDDPGTKEEPPLDTKPTQLPIVDIYIAGEQVLIEQPDGTSIVGLFKVEISTTKGCDVVATVTFWPTDPVKINLGGFGERLPTIATFAVRHCVIGKPGEVLAKLTARRLQGKW